MGDEYSFLQEKIKDEAGSPKRMRKNITRMIILGFIFGIIACFTFFVSKPLVEEFLGQDKKEVSIPKDEETEDVSEDEKEDTEAQIQAEEKQQIKLLKTLQNTAKAMAPSVVNVSGQKTIEKDSEIKRTSGLVIADNGSELLVLSRALSEKTLKNVKITFADGKEYSASVKMKDNNIGIVVCAVKKEIIDEDTWKQIEIAKLGNSLRTKVGDPAIVIGRPQKEEKNVSYGFIVSSEEKKVLSDGYTDLLRADVAGATFEDGMIFDQNGEMVGIIITESNEKSMLITAYGISDIKIEVERLSNGEAVPYIGIRGVEVPEEVKEEGLEAGVWIEEVDTDSPSMEAGIQPGDIITQIEDSEIGNMIDYRTALLKQPVKKTITLTGFRKGADDEYVELEFNVVVGQK